MIATPFSVGIPQAKPLHFTDEVPRAEEGLCAVPAAWEIGLQKLSPSLCVAFLSCLRRISLLALVLVALEVGSLALTMLKRLHYLTA